MSREWNSQLYSAEELCAPCAHSEAEQYRNRPNRPSKMVASTWLAVEDAIAAGRGIKSDVTETLVEVSRHRLSAELQCKVATFDAFMPVFKQRALRQEVTSEHRRVVNRRIGQILANGFRRRLDIGSASELLPIYLLSRDSVEAKYFAFPTSPREGNNATAPHFNHDFYLLSPEEGSKKAPFEVKTGMIERAKARNRYRAGRYNVPIICIQQDFRRVNRRTGHTGRTLADLMIIEANGLADNTVRSVLDFAGDCLIKVIDARKSIPPDEAYDCQHVRDATAT